MSTSARNRVVVILAVCLLTVAPARVRAVTVVGPERSLQRVTSEREGRLKLDFTWHQRHFYLNPSGRGTMPVDVDAYREALDEVSFPLTHLGHYRIFVLPRALSDHPEVLAFSFPGPVTVVFAPGFSLTREAVHRLAVHELGHAVDFAFMDTEKWLPYRELRGIADTKTYNDSSPFRPRQPREIFAEDFRCLFGGPTASKRPHVNPELAAPRKVRGLREFFLSLIPQDETGGRSERSPEIAER